jgi:hypothetical protein
MKARLFGLFLMLASLAPAQQARSDAYRDGIVTPPLPKPRFVLTDTSGARFDFWNRTQGSVTLLFFGYTNCPDQCPMHMSNIGVALKKLPPRIADQVKLVFVTTDPARDTPRNCAGGSTVLINILSASPETKLLWRRPRTLRAFLPPKRPVRPAETTQWLMLILLSRTPMTI